MRFFMVFLTAFFYAGAMDYEAALEEWAKKGEWLPFKLKVPDRFVYMSLVPGGNPGLESWCGVGEEEAIRDLWEQVSRNRMSEMAPKTGLIRLRFSYEVVQAGAGFDTSCRGALEKQFKQMGGKNLNFKTARWGSYPLLILEADFNQTPLRMAWVGLNEPSGLTVLVQYMFSKDKVSYEEDLVIWEEMIAGTEEVSKQELMEKMNRLVLEFQNQL